VSARLTVEIGDGHRPDCQRCLKSQRRCSYTKPPPSIAFRHSRLSSLAAIAIDLGVAKDHENSHRRADGEQTHVTQGRQQPQQQDQDQNQEHENENENERYVIGIRDVLRDAGALPAELSWHDKTSSRSYDLSESSTLALSATAPENRLFDRNPTDLLTPLEGELLQFYVENLGPWVWVLSQLERLHGEG
jgi:hypothetical protein